MDASFKSVVTSKALEVRASKREGAVNLSITRSGGDIGITIAATDAPALALAVLQAAGHKGSSDSTCAMQAHDLLEQHVHETAAKTEAAERAAAREKRRDELARDIHTKTYGPMSTVPGYANSNNALQTAIDHIIDLEARA